MTHKHHRIGWWGIVGLAIGGMGLWALLADVEGWNAVWYVPAWYGYLLVLDAVIFRLQGESFLSHRRRELAAMMFWSAPFWFLFEAYNLVVKNWYYVFVVHTTWVQAVTSWLAFATVLPACFVHAELIKSLGWWHNAIARPVRVQGPILGFFMGFGGLCIVLPLLLPRQAYWMVWGAMLGVPEALNYRLGSPSLLRDWERGDFRRTLRLLTGGLGAGFAWEGLNYWARCKWIYTVPGLEDWKLFEMPLLGFVGFPVLALESFAFYSLLCHFLRGSRTWERSDEQRSSPIPFARYAAFAFTAIAASGVIFAGTMRGSVQSHRPLLSELDGLDANAVQRLRDLGLPTPERLVGAVHRDGLSRLSQHSRIDRALLEQALTHAALAIHKGMGTQAAALLRLTGISRVADLTDADAATLFAQLQKLAAQNQSRPPRLAEIKVWIRAANIDNTPRR